MGGCLAVSRVRTLAGTEEERDHSGLVQLLTEEDDAEDEEPCLLEQDAAGQCPEGDRHDHAPDAAHDPQGRRGIISVLERPEDEACSSRSRVRSTDASKAVTIEGPWAATIRRTRRSPSPNLVTVSRSFEIPREDHPGT